MDGYRLALVWVMRFGAAVWLIMGLVNAWTSFTLASQPPEVGQSSLTVLFFVDQASTAILPSVLLASMAEILALMRKLNAGKAAQ